MNSNMISQDRQQIRATEGVYGTGRITYLPVSPRLAGRVEMYDAGTLKKAQYKQVSYEITQKFPEDQLSAVLEATMTELPQVTARPSTFAYNQCAEGVEFIYSALDNVTDGQVANIKASTVVQLLKKWDNYTYNGRWAGNEGFVGHSKSGAAVHAPALTGAATDFDNVYKTLIAQASAAKTAFGVSAGDILYAIPDSVMTAINTVDANGNSNRAKLELSLPNVAFVELPENVAPAANTVKVIVKPFVTLHHGILPQQYGEKTGDYGLSKGTLFALENAAVEVEVKGGIYDIVFDQ